MFSENGNYPYFTRTVLNNGIAGYVDYLDDEHKIAGGCLAIGMIGMQFFYMGKDFYAGQFTKRAVPKNFVLTPNIAIFLISILNKKQRIFQSVLVGNFEKEFNNSIIRLPVKKDEIDFEFMESFIAELDAQRIAELDAYLSVSNLKDYVLTEEEKKVLDDFNNLKFEEYNITDIFDIKNTGNILSTEVIANSGDTPYLCASAENNAVSTYIKYNEQYLDKGNCIFIGGKTFVVTYQENDFYSNDSHNLVLYLKGEVRTKLKQLYLATCVYKSLKHKYSWGDSVSKTKIKTDKIMLPSFNGKPDFSIMECFITAIQKLVIKDLVFYNDLKMAAAKRAVNNKK